MLTIERLSAPPEGFLVRFPEDGLYYKAFQDARVEGFDFGYLAVSRDEARVAVAPYFLMDFRLGTMLPDDSWLGGMLSRIKIKIACVGHPSVDLGQIDGELSAPVLEIINRELARHAPLVSYKGFDHDLPLGAGFVRARGLPVPVLKINGDYYSGLKSSRRNYLKRKMKLASGLKYEERDDLPDRLIPHVYRLYLNVYQNADIRLECLSMDYFYNTKAISKWLLFYEADTLIGFTQVLCKNGRMVHKYIGMDYASGRKHGLYFMLFLKAIDVCARDGLTELELGVTAYEFKKKLGSHLVETHLYYRHNNRALNWLLGKFYFLLEP
ncbi:MAG: GNAT family N-acetyltransferase [Gallionellaceae bacterium]|nr:GNAT family N-acetyltransferase [Gallionellaceae bacterium]